MKYFFTITFIIVFFFLFAEIIIYEDFSGTFPPDGWDVIGGSNWMQQNTNHASGTAPEAFFNRTPSTTGTQRLAILPVNTVGATELDLE